MADTTTTLANELDEGYVVPEPDWGVLMFWEDLTYIFTLIADFFKGLFGLK